MKKIDISIVLNAHREGTLLSFTLRSLVDTTLHAKTKGLVVELIAVLDSPDAATRAVLHDFESEAFARIERIEVKNASLGPSRNAGLLAARGAFTATVDGDDVYSFNYLANMHAAAASGGLSVALPSLSVWFDGDWMVLRFEPLSRTGRFRLAGHHTFMSCILAPTAFLRELGYRDCAGGRTFAYEDWDLTCRAVAAGADIRTAEEAVLFYRRHPRSIMAGLADAPRLVLPNALFDPEAFAIAGDGEAVLEDGETLRSGLLALRTSHALAELVAHASAIDPRIDPTRLRAAEVWTNAMFGRGFGETFYTHCRSLAASRFDSVLVVESLATAPEALQRMAEAPLGWLVIETVGTTASVAARSEGSRIVALDVVGRLPPERRPEMIVRLVHAFAARARLHLVLGGECGVLAAFPEAFACNNVIVYQVAGIDVAPPDAFSIVDFVMFADAAVMDALVSREPIYATKADMLPALITAAEAGAWLALLEARLEPRTGKAQWTNL